MTAYAQYETKNIFGNIIWEIKSLNQRYLDIYINLPEEFYIFENIIRERLRCRVTRGKVSCILHVKNSEINDKNYTIVFNKILAKKIIKISKRLEKNEDTIGKIHVSDILKWPDVITIKKKNLDIVNSILLESLDIIIENFVTVRKKEGQELKFVIEKKLKDMQFEVQKIREKLPEILKLKNDRFFIKIKETQLSYDANRLEQEILILLQRMDIEEELDRLDVHINNAHRLLSKTGAIGRHFDFLTQELIRESNTIASKSMHIFTTRSAIKLKVLIEQVREQVQNIE